MSMAGIEQLLANALALGDDGRWNEMADLLSAALGQEPDDPYLLCWLGVAERELDRDGDAYELFKRCLAQQPVDPQLLALAGAGLAAFDDPEAEPALRAAALTGPDLPITRLQYGAYLAREGLFEDGLEHLHAAVALAPEDPTVHAEMGVAFALKGDLANAADSMEQALDLAPDDSWTRVLLGLVEAERGELAASAESLIHASRERADDGEAHALAAIAATAAGWADAAEDALARLSYAAHSVDPNLIQETDEHVTAGPQAARKLLLETLAPSVLHDRLVQPL